MSHFPDVMPSTGCLLVVLILSCVGLVAIIAGAWWFFSQISIVWGGP